MKILKYLIIYPLAIILLVIAGFLAYQLFVVRLPDTTEMKSYFSSHQAEFEKVNTEILSRLKTGQAVKSKDYKNESFLAIEATLNPTASIKYYTHRLGVGLGAFGTGIAYLESPPDKTYPGLEEMAHDSSQIEGFVGYSKLSDNWYIISWEID